MMRYTDEGQKTRYLVQYLRLVYLNLPCPALTRQGGAACGTHPCSIRTGLCNDYLDTEYRERNEFDTRNLRMGIKMMSTLFTSVPAPAGHFTCGADS